MIHCLGKQRCIDQCESMVSSPISRFRNEVWVWVLAQYHSDDVHQFMVITSMYFFLSFFAFAIL